MQGISKCCNIHEIPFPYFPFLFYFILFMVFLFSVCKCVRVEDEFALYLIASKLLWSHFRTTALSLNFFFLYLKLKIIAPTICEKKSRKEAITRKQTFFYVENENIFLQQQQANIKMWCHIAKVNEKEFSFLFLKKKWKVMWDDEHRKFFIIFTFSLFYHSISPLSHRFAEKPEKSLTAFKVMCKQIIENEFRKFSNIKWKRIKTI